MPDSSRKGRSDAAPRPALGEEVINAQSETEPIDPDKDPSAVALAARAASRGARQEQQSSPRRGVQRSPARPPPQGGTARHNRPRAVSGPAPVKTACRRPTFYLLMYVCVRGRSRGYGSELSALL